MSVPIRLVLLPIHNTFCSAAAAGYDIGSFSWSSSLVTIIYYLYIYYVNCTKVHPK